MSLINYLGTFDTLTAIWEAYPEGGKEGDYIIIGEEYYKWDKYSSSWSLSAYIPKEAKVAEEDYFTPTKDISEDIVDIPDNTNVYLNFLGYFSTLNEAWEVYPEGGKEGDYIIIAEQHLWWNKYTQEWDNAIIASSDITDVEIDITLPSSCVNPLGRFDSLADAWRKHPEGGREGDYIQIAEDIYKWDKYLTAWINIKELPSSELMPIVPTFTEDVVEYSDGYINYIGTFDTLEQVWLVYPEGGKEGDYIIVDGERYRWNKLTNNWGEVDPDAETPARPVVSIFGDLHIHNDTVIGEKLYAEILNTFTTKRWIIEQGYLGVKDITPTLIMSNIVPDNVTIGIKDGKLVVIGGGTADSISWEDITNKPSWLEGEEGFVTISSEQTIRAHKNFEKGISVQGAPISYDAVKKVWIFDANMLVTGGLAWNSSLDGFKPETITDAVIVDGITLGRTPEGALCVIGDIGGLDEEALQEYLDFNKYVTTNYVKDNYIAINGDQNVDGIKNFANGLKIGNALITYNAEKNAFILPANLLVEGGIAWNSSIDGFEPKTITDAVMIDDSTLGRNENGEIYVKGGAGGGGSIKYPLSWSGYSTGMYDSSAPANIAIPSLLSQLINDVRYITEGALDPYAKTTDVNSLLTDYLSKSGGTVDGKIFYGGGRISGDVKLTSMVVDDNANSGKLIFAGANYDYGDNDYKMGPYIQGINVAGWGKKKISFFQRDYSVEGYNADPVEVFSVMPDGEIQLNGTIHFTKEVPMIKMIENGWSQSKVMWHGWDSTEGDSLFLQVPSGAENNAYFKLCRLAPSILNTPFQVNGNITATTFLPTDNTAIQFPDGEYIDRWGNIVFSPTSGAWSVMDSNRNNKFVVWADGCVDTSNSLTVNGNILATGRIAWNSSRVLKDIIGERYLTLDELAQIKPYQYKWKDGRDDLVHAGAIADEVMEIMPETILTDSLGIHSMDYAQTAFVMAASLTPYVSDHERRIKDLETENKALKEEIEKLKRAA